MSLHIPAAISTCHAEDRETPPDSFQETRDLRGGYCDETVTSQHNRTRSTTRPSIWATCHCLPREKVGRIFEGFWDCPCPGQCAPRAGKASDHVRLSLCVFLVCPLASFRPSQTNCRHTSPYHTWPYFAFRIVILYALIRKEDSKARRKSLFICLFYPPINL
ncbi:Hypothetical protein NTJ_12053 [Nesidiocoris tenuis]|uniref:Uncharacterized protein n=1 Tax=Nesidiocoris tenuis TaxID=355587 RepID=A0ABN7B487_9HEMI|nr:Hypothetical protein NTJ_12053 [Nesidiocoris tenuis]